MRRALGHVVCASALAACAMPAGDAADFTPVRLPPLAHVLGSAPADADIDDDVKADGPLPSSYTDLVRQLTPVRDQGTRGVCTIFTSTALLEHLALRRGAAAPNDSEQLLQWSQKRERPGAEHTEASDLGEVMDNLAARGTVAEAAWPYQGKPWVELGHPECHGDEATIPVACFTNGEPPAAALAAPRQKLPVGRFLRTSAIKAYLFAQQTPVAIGLEFVDGAWSYPPTEHRDRPGAWERGEVPYPSARERAEAATATPDGPSGHAVLIVGWDDDYAVPVIGDDGRPVIDAAGHAVLERGFYIFKNSWGTGSWGKANPHGPGLGLLSQRYVDEVARAYVVGLPSGAPPPPGGERHDGRAGLPLPDARVTQDALAVDPSGPLSEATVEVVIAHARPSDLVVRLEHDAGGWTLWEHGTGDGIHGTWRLSGDLSRVDRGGRWTLVVEDSVTGVTGTLTRWSITFK